MSNPINYIVHFRDVFESLEFLSSYLRVLKYHYDEKLVEFLEDVKALKQKALSCDEKGFNESFHKITKYFPKEDVDISAPINYVIHVKNKLLNKQKEISEEYKKTEEIFELAKSQLNYKQMKKLEKNGYFSVEMYSYPESRKVFPSLEGELILTNSHLSGYFSTLDFSLREKMKIEWLDD